MSGPGSENTAAARALAFLGRVDWKRFLNRFGPLLALVLVYFAFAIQIRVSWGEWRMLSLEAVEKMAQQTVTVGVAAVGMTLVIIAAGIDLSAGSVIAIGAIVVASSITKLDMSPLVAACLGVAAGAFCGLANGLIITRLKVVPFIATLGTMLIVRGAAIGLSRGIAVEAGQTWLNGLLAPLPDGWTWLLVPPGAWIMILLAAGVAGMLRYTRLGRHIFAVGSSEETARLCGVAVERVKVIVFALSGAFAGLAGLMLMSYTRQGGPNAATGMELSVIAAVVIGGGSLSGGEGSILGTMVGAMIVTVITSGCQSNFLPSWVGQIVTGVIIVAAVALDRLRHRRSA